MIRPSASNSWAQPSLVFWERAAKSSISMAADIATYLPEDLLLLLDRTTMAVGVEGRKQSRSRYGAKKN